MATNEVEVRLQQKASEVVRDYGPAIHRMLADLNASKLRGQGKVESAEIGRKAVRWELTWQDGEITYGMHVAVTLADDGRRAFISRVLVQKMASTAYAYQGHTPTTMMKQINELNVPEIERAILAIWP